MFHPNLDDEHVRCIAVLLIHQARIAVCDCDCPCNCLAIDDFGIDIDGCRVAVRGKVYEFHAVAGPHPQPGIPAGDREPMLIEDEGTCRFCYRPYDRCTC